MIARVPCAGACPTPRASRLPPFRLILRASSDVSDDVPHPSSDLRTMVEAAAGGDEAAAGRLLAEHLGGLRSFIRLRMGKALRERESCSDIAQSVCREVLWDL